MTMKRTIEQLEKMVANGEKLAAFQVAKHLEDFAQKHDFPVVAMNELLRALSNDLREASGGEPIDYAKLEENRKLMATW